MPSYGNISPSKNPCLLNPTTKTLAMILVYFHIFPKPVRTAKLRPFRWFSGLPLRRCGLEPPGDVNLLHLFLVKNQRHAAGSTTKAKLGGYIKIPYIILHNLLAVIPKKKYVSIWHSSSSFGTNGQTCVARSVAQTKSSADRRGSAGAPMRDPGILWCYRIAHFMPWIPMNSQEIHMSNGWNPFFSPIAARWGHSR